jgi:molybdate transport system permease protein
MNWQALWLTLRLATLVAVILLAIALPLAYWLAFSKRKWKFLVEAVVAVPLVLPPTVLGFYVLVALGANSPIGQWWTRLTGHTLAFTFEGLVIGSIVYSLPFAVQPITSSFAAVDRKLLDASATLSVGRFATFRRVVLPLSYTGVIAGGVLSFAHTMGEFGVVLMVGGNIPGLTRTLSIDIFDRVEIGDFSGANTTALFLLVLSFVILSIVYALHRAPWGVSRTQ